MMEQINIHVSFNDRDNITDEELFERGQWLNGLRAELRRELEIDREHPKVMLSILFS